MTDLTEEIEDSVLEDIYGELNKLGQYSISSEGIFLASIYSLKKINKGSIARHLSIQEIKNVDIEVKNVNILDWIKKTEFIENSKVVENEYLNRVKGMDDILNSAKKILEKGDSKSEEK